jgi:outer membrane protein TolC
VTLLRSHKLLFLCALALRHLCGQQSAATPPIPSGPLSLDDCIQKALNAPSAVAAARQNLNATRYGVNAATSAFLPKTTVENSFTYNSPHAGLSQAFLSLNATHEYQTLITSSVELDTAGRLRAGLNRARADRDSAQLDLQMAIRDLRHDVALAYFQVLLARHLLESARESLGEAQRFEQLAEKLYNGGEVAQADVVKAQAQAAFSQQQVQQAELDAATANQQLASYWTIDVTPALDLVDPLKAEPVVPPGERVTQSTLSLPAGSPTGVSPPGYLKRPELLRFDAEYRGTRADFAQARADLFPTLTAQYQYGIDAPIYSWSYSGQAAFVSLSVPIWDFFHTRNVYKQLEIRAQIVETNKKIAERQFSRDYQNALARAVSALNQVKSAREQVRLSESNLQMSKIRYQGGEGPALDVVAAVQQLSLARSNYYGAYASYFHAMEDLKVAEGQ